MKYFYHQQGQGSLNTDEFYNALTSDSAEQTFIIDDTVKSAVSLFLQMGKGSVPQLKNSAFQFAQNNFVEIDAKGVVQEYDKKPSWALSEGQITQARLTAAYGLNNLRFMDGIKKLAEMPVQNAQSVLQGLLPNINFMTSAQGGSPVDTGKTDKKPRIQNLTAEQFKDFYDLMSSAVKKKKLPSMGYFVENGVIDPDLKRGFRTYYKIVAGQNMKPDNFTPGDAYFAEISKRLEALKSEGVDRSYNLISSQISKLDADLPISELTYKFNDWDSN